MARRHWGSYLPHCSFNVKTNTNTAILKSLFTSLFNQCKTNTHTAILNSLFTSLFNQRKTNTETAILNSLFTSLFNQRKTIIDTATQEILLTSPFVQQKVQYRHSDTEDLTYLRVQSTQNQSLLTRPHWGVYSLQCQTKPISTRRRWGDLLQSSFNVKTNIDTATVRILYTSEFNKTKINTATLISYLSHYSTKPISTRQHWGSYLPRCSFNVIKKIKNKNTVTATLKSLFTSLFNQRKTNIDTATLHWGSYLPQSSFNVKTNIDTATLRVLHTSPFIQRKNQYRRGNTKNLTYLTVHSA